MPATALFADRHSAHAAVEQLVQAGFARDEVSLAMSEDTHEREFGPSLSSRSGIRPAPGSIGVLGTMVAGLASFTAAASNSAGTALRVSGPLLAAMLRAGGLTAALFALGLAEPQARAVRTGLVDGSIVVGVHATADRAELAMQLLELAGGAAPKAA